MSTLLPSFQKGQLLDYFHFKRGLLMTVPCISKELNHVCPLLLRYLPFPCIGKNESMKICIRLQGPEALEPLKSL